MSQESKSLGFSIAMFAVIGAIVLFVMWAMSSVLDSGPEADMGAEAVAARIQPIGQLNTGEPMVASAPKAAPAPAAPAVVAAADTQAGASGGRSGADIYNSKCVACHASGVAGAPVVGNKDAWAPRLEQGMETLLNHSINGIKAMPPRGTCGDCSDDELREAVEYMVSKSS